MEPSNQKHIFQTAKQCEAWYPKLNQDGKNYLYYVDKFIATFEHESQVKLLNLIPESELPTFLKCLSFILVTCNLVRDFQFHDNFTRVERYSQWPELSLFNS
jgi:hypothetical protein